jgi:RNA polymerase sigma-70 factor (ECF subfamily)
MKKNFQEQDFLKAYDELSDVLFRHSFFRVSNREVALDLVQEAFLKTWNHMSRGNSIQNMRSFLYRVTNNLIIDYYRKSKSFSLDNLLDEGFDVADSGHTEIVESAEISQIKKALKTLPENECHIITLRYIDGLSIQEISELLNESENVISVRIHRALKKVKETIQP